MHFYLIGLVIFWILSIVLVEIIERKKSVYYPMFRFHYWAVAPIITLVTPFYLMIRAIMYITDKGYRGKLTQHDDDNLLIASLMVAFITSMYTITGFAMKNAPDTDTVKLVADKGGVICYATIDTHRDLTPFIVHSHCEAPKKLTGGK